MGWGPIRFNKTMQTLPIRLNPGDDLRAAIETAVRGADCRAAFVVAGIGSLSGAGLRFAGAEQPRRFAGDIEILSLAGSIAFDGAHSSSHLHMAAPCGPRRKCCWRCCRSGRSRVRRMRRRATSNLRSQNVTSKPLVVSPDAM